MAEPVRARRLADEEGRRLQQIVRRGKHESIRVRRAMIIMASASGTLVPAIARLVAADEDTVGDVIHAFSQKGLAALGPRWAGDVTGHYPGRCFAFGQFGPLSIRPCHGSAWARANALPGCASWANPIEAQFGPVRTFVMGNSGYRNHSMLARRLPGCLRWRNAHARRPGVRAAQRRARAGIRGERQQRWGRSRPKAA